MRRQGSFELLDGREVTWAARGVEGGQPLLLIHGTPGSRVDGSADPTLYERLGVDAVSFDRAGYGRSTRNPGHTVLDVADDALAVADEHGWDSFAVLGVSGGGPHALALGKRAPERIGRLGIAVGVAPIELVDPDDLIEHNRESMRKAQEGRESLEEFLAGPAAALAADPDAAIDAVMADAPEADRELLAQDDIRGLLLASLREAFSNGPGGWYDDAWALSRPWGFDLREVVSPVHMWYGEIDRNVPLASIRAMAEQLNVASFEILPGAGHLGWLREEERVLRELLT